VLVELTVTEQRCRAVLEVQAGVPVTEVAERFGVSRQAVHRWVAWYRDEGLAGLGGHSSRPASSPKQTAAEVEAAICELRRNHPRWGARRIEFELGRNGCPGPIPSRITVHRVLIRHGLVVPTTRRRRREDYQRWQREVPMELWQMDIVGGIMLASGSEAKVVTGVDDHSRFCVIAAVMRKATGRAVCLAFAEALQRFGIPDEVLTDNGKQFTGRFTRPRPAEVMFERICQENGIVARNTKPRSPTTTGKVERFHQTLQRELPDDIETWPDIETAQAAIDAFRDEYNTNRPHQSLDMAFPADLFTPRQPDQRLPLRLPATLTAAPAAPPQPVLPEQRQAPTPAAEGVVTPPLVLSANGVDPVNLAVEFTRVVPASGNLCVCQQQFWLGPDRAGTTITFWADTTVVHLNTNGIRLKSVPSRLTVAHLQQLLADGASPAAPPPVPAGQTGDAIEVDRLVNSTGLISLAGRQHPIGSHYAGRRLTVRLDHGLLQLVDDDGVLLRSLPNPLTPCPASPHPRRPTRRPTTPTSTRTRTRPTPSQQPRHPRDRRAEDPGRYDPRRPHPRRRIRRPHLPHLRQRRTDHRGRPHHHQADRPLQGPQARTTTTDRATIAPAGRPAMTIPKTLIDGSTQVVGSEDRSHVPPEVRRSQRAHTDCGTALRSTVEPPGAFGGWCQGLMEQLQHALGQLHHGRRVDRVGAQLDRHAVD
jgi:transposase InsO family protein